MSESEYAPVSIGLVSGGPGPGNGWARPLQHAMRTIKHAREGVVTALSVNVVVHVPGEYLSPDYSGLRTGTFSRKTSDLMIQVALGEEVPDDPLVAIESYLHQAIDLALEFARDEAFEVGDLSELHDIVNRAAAVW